MQPRSGVAIAVALLGASIAMAQTSPFPIPSTVSTTLSFGVLGLASGETLRLNVVNVVRIPPPIAVALTACRAELDLYDGQGKLLKQKVIDNLGFGAADFLDLNRTEITATAARVPVAPVVKVGSNQWFFCSITPTIEVYDNVTGRASIVLALPAPTVFPRPLMFAPGQ
jgi:hypothetical protein